MYTKTARRRYEAFCAQHVHLFKLVPLKHLAYYLGVTLETLSRLQADTY